MNELVGDSTEKCDEQCLFCDQNDGYLHRVLTLEIDTKVRMYATELHDIKVLSKLAGGYMVSIDSLYHSKCLVTSTENVYEQSVSRLHAIAFAEVVSYIKGFRECQETVPVFTLVEFCKLYSSIFDQTARIHTTRLKEKLEAEIPEFMSYKQGRDIVLAFDQHMGDIILLE